MNKKEWLEGRKGSSGDWLDKWIDDTLQIINKCQECKFENTLWCTSCRRYPTRIDNYQKVKK